MFSGCKKATKKGDRHMKHILGVLCIQLMVIAGSAQDYIPVNEGSSVTFKIKNLGFNTDGSVKGLQGKIHFDPSNVSQISFDVSVDANTISTDNEMRDDHLRKTDYFDVKNYPRIHFVSTSVTPSGKNGSYQITGKLTIKSTTREISFPFVAAPMGSDYIFSGQFKIDRKDFDIGGTSTISNSLTVSLAVLAKKA